MNRKNKMQKESISINKSDCAYPQKCVNMVIKTMLTKNDILDKKIDGISIDETKITPYESYQIYQRKNPAIAFFKVEAFSDKNNLPISKVTVTISKKFPSGIYIIGTYFTDEYGQTPLIELPAPVKNFADKPNENTPHSTFDIAVEKEGYVSVSFLNVPFFEDFVTLQPLNMLPLSALPNSMTCIAKNKFISGE